MHDQVDNYRHIAVALDFSAISDRLLRRAVGMAAWHGADLSVVHVVDDALLHAELYSEFAFPTLDIDQWTRLREEAARRLEARVQAIGAEVRATSHLLIGSPKAEIVRFVDEKGVDLLVMGSHGHRGVLSWLGSTTDGVLHRASCDLMIVRPDRAP